MKKGNNFGQNFPLKTFLWTRRRKFCATCPDFFAKRPIIFAEILGKVEKTFRKKVASQVIFAKKIEYFRSNSENGEKMGALRCF